MLGCRLDSGRGGSYLVSAALTNERTTPGQCLVLGTLQGLPTWGWMRYGNHNEKPPLSVPARHLSRTFSRNFLEAFWNVSICSLVESSRWGTVSPAGLAGNPMNGIPLGRICMRVAGVASVTKDKLTYATPPDGSMINLCSFFFLLFFFLAGCLF